MAGDNSPAQRPTVHSGHPLVVFYGKCGSTREAPLSLLRQLHAVATALPEPISISACFADIGVWNRHTNGAPRVLSLAGRRVHGGLIELLRQAHDRHRRFDVVVCVDESRLPRRMSEHQAVLRELTECEVHVTTLTTLIPQGFPASATSSLHAWSFRLSDWATEVHNLVRHLTSSPTASAGGGVR
jgi:hypothetical protein